MEFTVKYKSFILRSLPSIISTIIMMLVLIYYVEINTLYMKILSILFIPSTFIRIAFIQRIYIFSVIFYDNKIKFNYYDFYKEKEIEIDINRLRGEIGGLMLGGGITEKTLILKKDRKKILKQYAVGYWSEDKIKELSDKIIEMKRKIK